MRINYESLKRKMHSDCKEGRSFVALMFAAGDLCRYTETSIQAGDWT